LCGLQNLSREERLSRANEILKDTDLKQSICHQILGCTHKDVEKSMLAVVNERQLTEEQVEQLELEEMAPEKFDPEITFKVNKSASNVPKEVRYGTYTREQVHALLNPPKTWDHREPDAPPTVYPTMSREDCERLVKEHFEYKDNAKKKKEEFETWDSLKTTELDLKIDAKTKRSTSTKG